MASTLSSPIFLKKFWFLAVFVVFFHSHKTYCDVLLITKASQTSLISHRGIAERIHRIPMKAFEFNGC